MATKVTSQVIETQQSWQSPTFLNNWTNFGGGTYETAGYMKDSMGFVHIKGVVKGGTVGSVPIFNLPSGYRPAMQMYIIQLSNGTVGQVDVRANGDVCLVAGSNVSLGLMITFKAEA